MEPESVYTKLAQSALELYVKKRKRLSLPEEMPEELSKPSACFVSLKKEGALRGCIGTIEPREETLAQEIIENAISAATRDPRFPPVTEEELAGLEYSVDVLSRPEPIANIEEHNPKTHGLIAESKSRRGLLLPDLEGIDTAERQLEICLTKAGLTGSEPIKLYSFTARRFY